MGFDIIEDFPFMLRRSKHSEPSFSNLLAQFVCSVSRRSKTNFHYFCGSIECLENIGKLKGGYHG
jgi:hypothetical protein